MSQQPLRVLRVSFALPPGYDATLLPKLRGAIAEKAGLEHDEFHNHNNADDAAVAFLYRYPRIQYRLHNDALLLVCLNEGIDALQHFFAQPDWTLALHTGESISLRISDLKLYETAPEVVAAPQGYQLRNWYALNQENYARYQSLQTIDARRLFLQHLIVNQIVLFMREFGYEATQPVVVNIERFYTNFHEHKGRKVKVFDIHFTANVLLPHHIGLGKATAMGFGALIGAHRKKL